MDTDDLAIKAAIYTCNQSDPEKIRIVRIKNTKELGSVLVSENLL